MADRSVSSTVAQASAQDMTRIDGHPGIRTMIEITSGCNLRCSYCQVSGAGWVARTLDVRRVAEMTRFLEAAGARTLTVSGTGETTTVDGWETLCDDLVDRGFELRINSNFAIPFTERMIATLARFKYVNVSIDSVDRDILQQVRRKVRLDTIRDNLDALRRWCAEQRLDGPRIQLLAVVSDLTLAGIQDLVKYGIEKRVDGMQFYGLVETDLTTTDGATPRSIAALSNHTLAREATRFEAAIERAKTSGIETYVTQSLWDIFNAARHAVDRQDPGTVAGIMQPEVQDGSLQYVEKAQAGQTRLCQDPWDMYYVRADGRVQPCCGGHAAVGHVDNLGNGFPNTDEAIQLREELLSGSLSSVCRNCGQKPLVDVADLRRHIRTTFYSGSV